MSGLDKLTAARLLELIEAHDAEITRLKAIAPPATDAFPSYTPVMEKWSEDPSVQSLRELIAHQECRLRELREWIEATT